MIRDLRLAIIPPDCCRLLDGDVDGVHQRFLSLNSACLTRKNSPIRSGRKQGRVKGSSDSGAASLEGQAGSTTAPPTSLTLDVSGREWRADFGPRHTTAAPADLDGWSVERGWVKPMRETVVGFLGLTSDLARRIADLINRALGMPIIYHQKYPL
ncbi:hypothetical protein SprV_0602149600 [Sparganum proliferum]